MSERMRKGFSLVLLMVGAMFSGTAVAAELTDNTPVTNVISVSTAASDEDLPPVPTESPDSAAAQGAAAAAPTTETRVHRVEPGEYLSLLAQRYLGDPMRYWEIVEANKDRYPSIAKNPDLIYSGWELKIPGVPTDGSTDANSFKPAAGEGIVRVGTNLNVRSGPWGSVIGSLQNGNRLKILGRSGEWFIVDYNGQQAYVHANYVETADHRAGSSPVLYPDGSTAPNVPYVPAATAIPSGPGTGRFGAPPCQPMPSRASSEFGPRDMAHSDFHNGIDLPVANGTRLNALGDGVVTGAGFEPGGGRYIKVRYDNGMESFYCHLQSSSARIGERVVIGQEIARSDNTGQWTTGAHLHMGIKVGGRYVNPRTVAGLPLP